MSINSRSIWQSFANCLTVLIILVAPLNALAQDQITVRDERTGKVSQFEALVIAWDASRLVYSGNGRESSMPASRVVKVNYPKTEAHLEANELFESGRFLQAWQRYENALAEEPREWVKVEIIARQLRCAMALNRHNDALAAFYRIQQATPQSRFFHLIPLAWGQNRPPANMVSIYQQWLDSADESQKLIAASWLLTSDATPALTQLKDLAQSVDARVAHLATAQLWRIDSISASAADLQRWLAAIERMPEDLQPGARFQVALARKHMNRDNNPALLDQSIIGMLQIPILFPEQYQLCGDALLQALQMLQANGRAAEAGIVLSDLKRNYGHSTAAASLGSRVENLDQ